MADGDRISKMRRTVQQANQYPKTEAGKPVLKELAQERYASVPVFLEAAREELDFILDTAKTVKGITELPVRFLNSNIGKPVFRAVAPETTEYLLDDPEATGIRGRLRDWYTSPKSPFRTSKYDQLSQPSFWPSLSGRKLNPEQGLMEDIDTARKKKDAALSIAEKYAPMEQPSQSGLPELGREREHGRYLGDGGN